MKDFAKVIFISFFFCLLSHSSFAQTPNVTCWVTGRDTCGLKCNRQVDYACSDGRTYSNIEKCCDDDDGGGGNPTATNTPIPTNTLTPTPIQTTISPQPSISGSPTCPYNSGIKTQFRFASDAPDQFQDEIQAREGDQVVFRNIAKPNGPDPIEVVYKIAINSNPETVLNTTPAISQTFTIPQNSSLPQAPFIGQIEVRANVLGFTSTNEYCTSVGKITVIPYLNPPIIYPPDTMPECSTDGWIATFKWAHPTQDPRVNSYILRANFSDIGTPLWFVNDGSDIFDLTGYTQAYPRTIIPYKVYDGWSVQSVIKDIKGTYQYDQNAIASSAKFMCKPQYLKPQGFCFDNGSISSNCTYDNWISEYHKQMGYDPIKAVSIRSNPYPDVDNNNVIDLVDFELIRKSQTSVTIIPSGQVISPMTSVSPIESVTVTQTPPSMTISVQPPSVSPIESITVTQVPPAVSQTIAPPKDVISISLWPTID